METYKEHRPQRANRKAKNDSEDSDDNPFDLPNPPIAEPMPDNKIVENPFDSLAVPITSRVKQIWSIGGGKGGVGKSLLALNVPKPPINY